jgi:hypothetical protein
MPAWAHKSVAVTPYFMALRSRGALGDAHFWPPVRGIAHSQLPGKQDGYNKKRQTTRPACVLPLHENEGSSAGRITGTWFPARLWFVA